MGRAWLMPPRVEPDPLVSNACRSLQDAFYELHHLLMTLFRTAGAVDVA